MLFLISYELSIANRYLETYQDSNHSEEVDRIFQGHYENSLSPVMQQQQQVLTLQNPIQIQNVSINPVQNQIDQPRRSSRNPKPREIYGRDYGLMADTFVEENTLQFCYKSVIQANFSKKLSK